MFPAYFSPVPSYLYLVLPVFAFSVPYNVILGVSTRALYSLFCSTTSSLPSVHIQYASNGT